MMHALCQGEGNCPVKNERKISLHYLVKNLLSYRRKRREEEVWFIALGKIACLWARN